MIITTAGGATFNTELNARSNLIQHLIGNYGQMRMSTLTIIGIAGTHEEFMEERTDLLVKDQFGQTYEICEDYIWQ
jgi:hypothetical protein